MKSFWFLLAAIFLLTSCNNTRKETIATDYIPKNAGVVFNISDSESLNSNLNNNNFLSEFSSSKSYKNLREKLALLDSLNLKNEVLLCFLKAL